MINKGHPMKGLVLMGGSAGAFCVMASIIKYASFLDPYRTTLFRFVIGLGLLGVAALFGKLKLHFVNGWLLFSRGLTGGAGVFFLFLSIMKLGIAKGTIISYSYPIFASIMSVLFLKERIGVLKWGAIAIAFVGIYLLTGEGTAGITTVGKFGKYEVLAVFGAIFSGIAVVSIKRLHETDSTYAIFFAQCVVGLWLMIIPANLVPRAIGYFGGILLLGIGIFATVGQLLMTEGYRYLSVTSGSLLGMLVPVLNFFAGVVVFHEHLSLWAIVGSILILTSCIAVTVDQESSG
jgi:drug/metabolite transporter (DMT)-like permease